MRAPVFLLASSLILLAAPGCNVFGVLGDGEGAPCEADEACPDGMRCVEGECTSDTGSDDASQHDATADAAVSDAAGDDSASGQDAAPRVDASAADSAQPDAGAPDASAVGDAASADSAAPDATAAGDAATPDTSVIADAVVVVDAASADTVIPDAALPDTSVSDAAAPDTLLPDTLLPDTLLPDTNRPDTLFCEDLDGDGHDAISVDCPGSDDNCDDDTNNWTGRGCGNCIDNDRDGFHSELCDRFFDIDGPDCDDTSVLVGPHGLELADDGVDNDCADGDLTALGDADGIYVNAANTCPGAGTTGDPYCSLTNAISVATLAGVNIYVTEGSYVEDVVVDRDVNIFGSYDPSNWAVSNADGHQARIFATSANTPALLVESGVQALVYGFSCYGTDASGTGSTAYGVSNKGTLSFVNNYVNGGGAGISESIGIENTGDLFSMDNRVRAGGNPSTSHARGVVVNAGTATFYNDEIFGDLSNITNVGLLVYGGVVTAMNSYFSGQFSTTPSQASVFTSAVGIDYASSNVLLVNNTLSAGQGPGSSYGINQYDGQLTAVNNIIDGGTATGGAAICVLVDYGQPVDPNDPSDPNYADYHNMTTTLINNDLWGASIDQLLFAEGYGYLPAALGDVNNCLWEHCANSAGNISDTHHLQSVPPWEIGSASECIDQGVDGSAYVSTPLIMADIEGDLRPQGSGWDIGCDEY
jgi:hypothetical protein